jgi:dipeptidyl aminopeptidase/acylaminoacyl peptidase
MKKSHVAINILLMAMVALFLIRSPIKAQIDITYQKPPEVMMKLVDAPTTPSVWISPDGSWMLLLGQPSLPSIEEVAQPELRIAGLRINPVINGQSRLGFYNSMKLLNISAGNEYIVQGLPDSSRISNLNWSPDGMKVAFSMVRKNGIELWYLDISSKTAYPLTGPILNDILWSDAFQWFPDSKNLLFKGIVEKRSIKPEKPIVPEGPVVSENVGKKSPVRTYQDLLKNPYDEELFDYYLTAQLFKVDLDKEITTIGERGIIRNFSVSPNGKYILIETIHRPYSYLVPWYNFPVKIEIWDNTGTIVRELTDLPLADDIPKGFGSVRKGPRSLTWRADVPSTLFWIEALDGGDASLKVDYRDQLMKLEAPFSSEPEALMKLQLRYNGISWGTGEIAIINESWWETRRSITSLFSPDHPETNPKVLFDRSTEDVYNDPGRFVMKSNPSGFYVLETGDKGKSLFLRGTGASPEGNKPFLDKYFPAKQITRRLWQSSAPYYEYPVHLLGPNSNIIITRRESVIEPPNYFIRNLKTESLKQITFFPHPHPELSGISKTLLKYYRKDGILLTATLYLPYKDEAKNKNLPVLMWAYPREFKSADAAGQVDDSPYRFDRIGPWSSLIWLTQGYAVLDDPKMPIIGEGDTEPNDTYIEQLVMSAEAAIDTLVVMGVADPGKIAIGGHSYGAFMTANLLAHSDLFKTGIARSGAYNRTLTPFGFQSEQRTFWEAPEVYFAMSPFMYADKINEPILLIHGEADNNSGTFPIQSERFYHALKGHGATVRLVMLPHESHGYRARESILHMLWEMNEWLDKYVKGN